MNLFSSRRTLALPLLLTEDIWQLTKFLFQFEQNEKCPGMKLKVGFNVLK